MSIKAPGSPAASLDPRLPHLGAAAKDEAGHLLFSLSQEHRYYKVLQTHKEVRLKRPPRPACGAAPSGPCETLINLLGSLLSFPRTTDLTCHVLSLLSDLRLTDGSVPHPLCLQTEISAQR